MNYNPTPRSEMLKSPEIVKRHHELVENDWLRAHLRIALQEMQIRASANTDANNFNACAAAHLRMLGAQDFVEIFLNLVETPVLETKKESTNLPGNVASLPRKN